jgi:hypothetical protein
MLKGLHNHWTKKGAKLMPKKPFESESEANEFLRIYGIKHYNAYLCADCGKWHIGHKI